MKKLYNKALMYQCYYTGRWSLFIGIIMFGFVSFMSISSKLSNTMSFISNFEGNTIGEGEFPLFFTSWVVIFAVYFSITGLNKKSVMNFLQSGPFSKEEIKKNQILTLILSLIIICISYIYIFLCITYREHEVILMIPNYYDVFIKDIIKLFVCGIAFISYISLMDMFFSNVVIEIIMTIITPFLCVFSISFILDIFYIITRRLVYDSEIYHIINDFMMSIIRYITGSNSELVPYGTKVTIGIILIISAIFFLVSWKLNKSFKMNNANKLFNFETIGVLYEILIVFFFVTGICDLILNVLYVGVIYKQPLGNSLLIFFICIICCVLFTLLIRKALHKIIRKYL